MYPQLSWTLDNVPLKPPNPREEEAYMMMTTLMALCLFWTVLNPGHWSLLAFSQPSGVSPSPGITFYALSPHLQQNHATTDEKMSI